MKLNVLVIGDAMLDVRRFGRCTRVNPEEPKCKVLDLQERMVELGGAANVARWLAACPYLDVSLLCHFGNDDAGQEFQTLCRADGIRLLPELYRTDLDFRTTVKERICQVTDTDQVQHLVRVDQDTETVLSSDEYERIYHNQEKPDMIVVADYHKSVCVGPWGHRLMQLIAWQRSLTVVNSKAPEEWNEVSVNYLVCNDKETLQAWPDFADNNNCQKKVLAECFVKTEGARGVTLYRSTNDTPIHVPSLAKQVIDVTGAGDAFLAGFAYEALISELHQGYWRANGVHGQLQRGSTWAAHCCGQIGCGMPIGCGESENVNMQLLGWIVVDGLSYNQNPILYHPGTGELAYEDLNHLSRFGAMPAEVEAIVREQL